MCRGRRGGGEPGPPDISGNSCAVISYIGPPNTTLILYYIGTNTVPTQITTTTNSSRVSPQ